MKTTGHRARRAAGLSLLELLVAMTVMAVGLLGILALHGSSIGAARRAQRLARAEALADARLEELGALDVPALEAAAGQVETRTEGTLGARLVHRIEHPPGAPDDLRLVTVEVSLGPPAEAARAVRQRLVVTEPP